MASDRVLNVAKQQLGQIYAQALLGAAEKAGVAETVVEELEAFVAEVFDTNPAAEELFSTPRIAPEQKLGVLDRTLGGRVQPVLLNTLKVVARHRRLDCVREITAAARHQLNGLRGRLEVQITTAEPLALEDRQRIEVRLGEALGQWLWVRYEVEDELLGGLVVRIGDTVYDASVARQLDQARAAALERVYQQIQDQADRFAVETPA